MKILVLWELLQKSKCRKRTRCSSPYWHLILAHQWRAPSLHYARYCCIFCMCIRLHKHFLWIYRVIMNNNYRSYSIFFNLKRDFAALRPKIHCFRQGPNSPRGDFSTRSCDFLDDFLSLLSLPQMVVPMAAQTYIWLVMARLEVSNCFNTYYIKIWHVGAISWGLESHRKSQG